MIRAEAPGILDLHIHEHATVSTQEIIAARNHLFPTTYHVSSVAMLESMAQLEVRHHILQPTGA